MTDAKHPKTFRDEKNEHIYRDPANKDKLKPDRTPPAVHGYFRIPAVWVGNAPDQEVQCYEDRSYSEVVFEKELSCGIFAYALRDGTFLFDFSKSTIAPMTVIPGFSYPDAPKPWGIIPENAEKYWLAEERAILRSRLLNVHQLLLGNAEREIDRVSATKGYPVSPWNMIEQMGRHPVARNRELSDRTRDLSGRVLNGHYTHERPEMFNRRTLSLACVEQSFELLDEVASRDDETLITVLEEAYKIGWHNLEGRFGECIVSGWTACEQILHRKWVRLLQEKGITGSRKKKLFGVNYTISHVIEFLNMSGELDDELYNNLEVARKARNKWAHEARHPKRDAVFKLVAALEKVLQQEFGISITLIDSYYSGTSSFPYWTFEKYHG
ncbi:MAG: hypothetical protein JKX94_06810 [Sneathiella sp.]|nr:hypothetical protein [Sneathiella sp.]